MAVVYLLEQDNKDQNGSYILNQSFSFAAILQNVRALIPLEGHSFAVTIWRLTKSFVCPFQFLLLKTPQFTGACFET